MANINKNKNKTMYRSDGSDGREKDLLTLSVSIGREVLCQGLRSAQQIISGVPDGVWDGNCEVM